MSKRRRGRKTADTQLLGWRSSFRGVGPTQAIVIRRFCTYSAAASITALIAVSVIAALIGGLQSPAAAAPHQAAAPQQAAAPHQVAIASPTETSYWLTTSTGDVLSFGSAHSFGSIGFPLNKPVVGMAPTPGDRGYWLVASDGGVFSYGDARFYGSAGGIRLNEPVVGMAPTSDAKGYWLVASDGGVFSYGDAHFYGSTGSLRLNKPVVGIAPTPDDRGYWLVASDGGVFSFGDARFYGSTGSMKLNKPVVGMAPAPGGDGYWLVASDGGIFSFGDARFFGSTGSDPGEPAEKVVPTRSGGGYWVVDQNGTAYPFGDAAGAPPVQGLLFSPVTPGDKAVLFAFAQLGKPYIWGGNGPVGYDCSGLALASWEHGAGVTFARVADDQYMTAGTPVALIDLEAGDLVFWGTSQTIGASVYHTAIYVGGGQIIQAAGTDVNLAPLGQWGHSQLMPHGMRP
jgi:NlpC/P60 family